MKTIAKIQKYKNTISMYMFLISGADQVRIPNFQVGSHLVSVLVL